MQSVNIVLILLALFGFFPLAIVLYKKRRVKSILTTGIPARARVYQIRHTRKPAAEIVHYTYYGPNGKQYTGTLTGKPGLYNLNDVIDIYYDCRHPRRSAMVGAWGSSVFVVFTILLAAFMLFAAYQIYLAVQRGEL